ncbi:MAG: hypothetical protein Q8P27_01765 [Candidatus Peregrinibacteria bacterium]|nr:hypothetical protein [Candidatus Peregrinibacteria bacterium]
MKFTKIIKFIGSLSIFLMFLSGMLVLNQEFAFADSITDVLDTIGDKTELENYETTVHADAPTDSGVKNIASAIFFAIDFVKYTLGSIAVFMLIINSMRMIMAGKESEEATTKEKVFLKYALAGLVLVFVADEAIQLAFYGQEGEFLRDEDTAAEFATGGADLIKGVYTFVEVFIGSIAVLMMVFSGLQILIASGSEEAVNSAKKRIYISSVGLIIIGLSEVFVKDVLFVNQGDEVDVDRGREIIVGLTNFLVSIMATVGVIAFVYAGFLYVLNFGNEEFTNKAKKIMFGAIAGIVLAAAAFAIVSTVIPVEGAQ